MTLQQIRDRLKEAQRCPKCNGGGVIIHPEWETFYKNETSSKILKLINECTDKHQIRFLQKQLVDKEPKVQEKIQCPECSGAGKKIMMHDETVGILLDLVGFIDDITPNYLGG
jgi:DNA-directed RNA polymerase subunit RPC12/RpoP